MIPSGHVYVFKKAVLTVKMAALIISRLAKVYCNRSIGGDVYLAPESTCVFEEPRPLVHLYISLVHFRALFWVPRPPPEGTYILNSPELEYIQKYKELKPLIVLFLTSAFKRVNSLVSFE